MATIDVSLPDKLRDWVESQARSGQYTDASDYVRDLIRRDRERSGSIAEVQGLIDEGVVSGVSDRSMDEVLEMARQRSKAILGE